MISKTHQNSRPQALWTPFYQMPPTLTGWGRWTDADVQAAKISAKNRIGGFTVHSVPGW